MRRRSRRASKFFGGALTALLLSTPLPAAPGSVRPTAQRPTLVVTPGQPTYVHLSSGETLTVVSEPRRCRDGEVLFETSTPGAGYAVVSAGGGTALAGDAEQAGWYVASFPCDARDGYRFIVRNEAVKGASGGLSLHVDWLLFASGTSADRERAVNLFVEAQSHAASAHATVLRAAIDQYKEAERAWAAGGDEEGEILALAGEARARLNLSEYAEALAALHRAKALSVRSPFFRAQLENLEAEIYLDKWDSRQALQAAEEGLKLGDRTADPWMTADALAGRGEAKYLTGDSIGRPDLEKALGLGRESGAVEVTGRALRCLSWIDSDEGRVTGAETSMLQAEDAFSSAGDERDAFDAMASLATLRGMTGDYNAALVGHSGVISLMRESGKVSDLAFLLANTANDYMHLNRTLDAIAYYQEAIGDFRRVGLLSGEQIVKSQLCMAEERAERLREALDACSQALAATVQIHDPRRIAVAMWRLGSVQQALGELHAAAATFQRAYEAGAGIHDPHTQAAALMQWGDVLEGLGDPKLAREKYGAALPLSQGAEDKPEQVEARFRIARFDFRAGDEAGAKSELAVALRIIDEERHAVADPELQASYFGELHRCQELDVEMMMRNWERDRSEDAARKALEASEAGRARTLLDVLAQRGDAPTVSWARDSRDVLGMQSDVARAYNRRLQLMLEGARKRDLEANENELTMAMDGLERGQDERRAALGSTSSEASPMKMGDILAASRETHRTLIEYALGTDKSYVWVIYAGGIEAHLLPARRIIESAVKEYWSLATARLSESGAAPERARKRVRDADAELPQAAARLSCMLLDSVLRPDMRDIVFVPDGELDRLPFAALPENGCGGGTEPLAARRQTVTAPSLSILLLRKLRADRETWKGDIVLLADPVFDDGDPRVHQSKATGGPRSPTDELALPRLYGTREEATAIAAVAGRDRAALYLDFDASLKTLLDAPIRDYRILHLASHGVFDPSAPELSGIVLTLVNRDGQPVSGFLNRHDVENLDLHSDLVVLSSCDSDAGISYGGEGVMGMTYAFLGAGARRVLSTLWSIDDETSKEWMVLFYTAMLRDGLSPAEALRRTQTQFLQNPATSAPYFWAGFTLTTTRM